MATLTRRNVGTPLGDITNSYGLTEFIQLAGSVASGGARLVTVSPNPDYLAQLNAQALGSATYRSIIAQDGSTQRYGVASLPGTPTRTVTPFQTRTSTAQAKSDTAALLASRYGSTQSAADKVANANRVIQIGIGGAGQFGQGPFSNTRVNLVGQVERIKTTDPRYTANAYADLVPDLYSKYSKGSINGAQLFKGALSYFAKNDKDTLNRPFSGISSAPTASVRFNSSGGGSLTFKFGSVSF